MNYSGTRPVCPPYFSTADYHWPLMNSDRLKRRAYTTRENSSITRFVMSNDDLFLVGLEGNNPWVSRRRLAQHSFPSSNYCTRMGKKIYAFGSKTTNGQLVLTVQPSPSSGRITHKLLLEELKNKFHDEIPRGKQRHDSRLAIRRPEVHHASPTGRRGP